MNIKFAIMNAKATCGSIFVLTGVRPVYDYVNGTRAAQPHGYAYDLKLPERKYEDLSVVIEGEALMPAPDNAVEVVLNGLELEIKWSRDKGNYIAGTATGIAPAPRT